MGRLGLLLAGDVGGTKTVLGLYDADDGPRQPRVELTFASREYPGLAEIVGDFCHATGESFDAACIGVAGPVVGREATVTNLQWTVSVANLQSTLGVEHVRLLNDLQAIGHAIPLLGSADLYVLNRGQPESAGSMAIVAPGTGLGEAFLTVADGRLAVHPSEGGHADFAPSTPEQVLLVQHVMRRFGHVSCERVCSGSGIPNLYAYLRDSGRYEEPAWLARRLAESDDPTPVIARYALGVEPQPAICVATMDLFVAILGAEAGNMALRVLATGGVYLGGGVPRRILPALEKDIFLEAFQAKGRMSAFLERIPVRVITNNRAALIGAAHVGLEQWRYHGA